MVIIKLPEEEKEQFRTMFSQLVGLVKQNNEITREELVAIAVQNSGISEATISEWIDRTISSLYEEGVLVQEEFDLMKYHFIALSEEFIGKLAHKVLDYAEKHPLTYMKEREKQRIEEQISFWEKEPDVVENIQKINELSLLKEMKQELEK